MRNPQVPNDGPKGQAVDEAMREVRNPAEAAQAKAAEKASAKTVAAAKKIAGIPGKKSQGDDHRVMALVSAQAELAKAQAAYDALSPEVQK